MNEQTQVSGQPLIVDHHSFQQVLDALTRRGYQVLGPTVRDGAIVYDAVERTDDFPVGWTDAQESGTYRLSKNGQGTLFQYTVGPHSWKQFLFPKHTRILTAERTDHGFSIRAEQETAPKQAFIGVRACELAAMRIQDQVFTDGTYSSSTYRERREQLFVVAVNCTRPGGTCFCASMGTGPAAERDYDIVLTEVVDGAHCYLLCTAGTPAGAEVLADVATRPATETEQDVARAQVTAARSRMGRHLNTAGLHEALSRADDHPRWEEVAARCLTCTSCTMVCPTCFCSTVEDTTDLTGQRAERWCRWDSCFTIEFSYIHGGSVRTSPASRYRQWLSHKLSRWIDQFGISGCVGCGRCITWCPVSIDITEEACAIHGGAAATKT